MFKKPWYFFSDQNPTKPDSFFESQPFFDLGRSTEILFEVSIQVFLSQTGFLLRGFAIQKIGNSKTKAQQLEATTSLLLGTNGASFLGMWNPRACFMYMYCLFSHHRAIKKNSLCTQFWLNFIYHFWLMKITVIKHMQTVWATTTRSGPRFSPRFSPRLGLEGLPIALSPTLAAPSTISVLIWSLDLIAHATFCSPIMFGLCHVGFS